MQIDSMTAPTPQQHASGNAKNNGTGSLIVNADDWGRDKETTERMFECLLRGTVSSVSAMVFMEDSERAAAVAIDRKIDAGLHLNFTSKFSAPDCPSRLMQYQQEVASYLLRRRLNSVIFHPGLSRAFEYVVRAQLDEYVHLYGVSPARIDGHHHMHLCANVLMAGLLPVGTLVRRNFSFQPGEKSLANRLYRKAIDYRLARRHRLVDFMFALPPLEPISRLARIFALAKGSVVEVETHPVNAAEYAFLMGEDSIRLTMDTPIAPHFVVPA
jgi:chitin disaccharide deacetylase